MIESMLIIFVILSWFAGYDYGKKDGYEDALKDKED